MRKLLPLICGVFGGFVCMILWMVYVSASSPTQETAQPKESLHLTAIALNRDYEANEVAASDKYTNKTLLITGLVKSIDLNATNQAYLVLEDGDYISRGSFLGVQAVMNSESETLEGVKSLTHGDQVTVVCPQVRRLIGSVMLRDCALSR